MSEDTIHVVTRTNELINDLHNARTDGARSVLKMAQVVIAADNEPPQVKDAFNQRARISESGMSKLRSIGATSAFYSADPTVLPMDREILFEMRGILPSKLEAGVAAGVINPEMKRGDFQKWIDPESVKEEPIEDQGVGPLRKLKKLHEEEGVTLRQILASMKLKPEESVELGSFAKDYVAELED